MAAPSRTFPHTLGNQSSTLFSRKDRCKRAHGDAPQLSRTTYFEHVILGTSTMKLKLSAIAALAFAVLPLAARADVPGTHPAYLHALSDLRAARWNLGHRPGDVAVGIQEDIAISDIDRAIGEVKKAARDDAKNADDHSHEDANLDRPGRLHRAVELLEQAREDLDREEDNLEARSLKRRALDHVDRAIEAAKHAIRDVEHNR